MTTSSHFRWIRLLTALLLAGAAPGLAHAQAGDASGATRGADDTTRRFGASGQVVISTDAALSFQRTTQNDVHGSRTSVTFAPAADFFLLRNFSLGGILGYDFTKAGSSKTSRFLIGPRVGYNFWLMERLSIWPKIGFSYAHTKATSTIDQAGAASIKRTVDQNAFALNLFAPVVYHPAPHFIVGLGPFLDTDLSGDSRVTSWGLRLTVGGWL